MRFQSIPRPPSPGRSPADVPAEIESITRGLASEQPRRTHWSSSRRLAGGIFMEKVELIPRFSGLSSGCDILRPTRRATSSGSMRSSSISSRSASLTKRNRSDKQFCHSHRGVPGRTLPDRSVFDNKLCRRNESPSELVASDILPTAGGTSRYPPRESCHSGDTHTGWTWWPCELTTPRSASTRPILSVVVSH